MNCDIRVMTTFPHHHKTKKLRRKLGAEGVCALMFLWLFAAENRPDGVLSGMDEDDICIAAQWDGDASSMLQALLEVGFLELIEGDYVIHDWAENNPWAASAPARKAKAEHAAKARWEKRNAISSKQDAPSIESDAASMNEHCSIMPVAGFSNAPSPIPSPSPSPNPSLKTKTASGDAFVLPDWLPESSWFSFVEMRKKIKKPMTDRAIELAIKKLDAMRSGGHDIVAIIDNSVLNCWQDLFLPKSNVNPLKSTLDEACTKTDSKLAEARRMAVEAQNLRAQSLED